MVAPYTNEIRSMLNKFDFLYTFGGASNSIWQICCIHRIIASAEPDIVTARSVELGSISLAT